MKLVNRTVKEVFEALARNGFEHLRGEWFEYLDGKVGGCVLGQTALNLGVQGFVVSYDDDIEGVGRYTEEGSEYALLTQLNAFRVSPENSWYIGELDNGGFGNRAGSLIISWNDKVETEDQYGNAVYALKTYAEVVKMARDILESHFDKTVTLSVVEGFNSEGLGNV